MVVEIKGQMFLLGGIIILTVLVIAGSSLRMTDITIQRRTLEIRFEDKIFDNIVSEIENALEFSYGDVEGMTISVYDFGNYSWKKMKEHSLDFILLYVGILANTSSSQMNITVVNIFDDGVNVSLELNTSPPQTDSESLAMFGSWETVFTFSPGEDYLLTITYNQASESVTIETGSGDVYVGFFDVRLETEKSLRRRVFQKSYLL